jgi:two-component system phosphate regulon sensor histidine kinase PhoR
MRLRVHHPLFAGFLGVIGLQVLLIVLLTGTGLRRELTQVYEQELRGQLNLAQALTEVSPTTEPDALARLITGRISNRVTFVSLDGRVLGDSFIEPSLLTSVENHADRPEVLGVMRGDSVSFAQRTSETVGRRLLYGARLAELDGEPVILRIATPLEEIDSAVAALRNTVALTGFLIMLLAFGAAFALSKAFTAPLVALADRAGQLAKGDFTSKVPLGRVAELQDLAGAFNRLTDELSRRLSELRSERDEMQTLIDCMAEGVIALTPDARLLRMNRAARAMLTLPDPLPLAPVESLTVDPALRAALERSVTTEAQSSEIELGDRRVLLASRALDLGGAVTTLLDVTEVRRLEKVRRDFVANASHELKTPLTSIRGFAETLVDDDPPEELRRQFLESIRANTLRLQRLVDDLLDLSRIESGDQVAVEEDVLLGEVAEEAWNVVSSVETDPPSFVIEGDALARGDPEGLFQIFRNLLENAVRHTLGSGEVRVTIRIESSDLAWVSVADDGEGIPAHALPRVFERFYRADSSRARDVGGTGLGLAIVKHLVQSMGGDVEVHSRPGFGTRMTFTVPLADPGDAIDDL